METRDRLWSPLLETVHADALDCVQANLAVLADRHGGAGAHLELGALLRFDTEPGPGGLPVVASSVPYRLEQARDRLGLRVAERWDDVHPGSVDGTKYVIADAFDLPWTPYFGRQHNEHTFLMSTEDTVVDAYHDETPWGPQRPGVWRVSPADLPQATVLLLEAGPAAPQTDVLVANARAMARAPIDSYLAAHTGSDQLVLDVWLLGRSRLLHALWLERHGHNAAEMRTHAKDWLAFASHCFVAWRRARDGVLPTAVLEDLGVLLRTDVALASRLAGTPDRHDVRAVVLAAIGEVLGIDEATALGAPTLRDLPGYNSFRLVDVVQRIEKRLGVEAPTLSSAALRDVDSLCEAFGSL